MCGFSFMSVCCRLLYSNGKACIECSKVLLQGYLRDLAESPYKLEDVKGTSSQLQQRALLLLRWQETCRWLLCRDPGYSVDTPYKLEDGRETHKWLQLQSGTNPKTMPISLISNGPINEKEWQHWKDSCNEHNKPQLNTHDCESTQERIKKASSYVLQIFLSSILHGYPTARLLRARRTVTGRPLRESCVLCH